MSLASEMSRTTGEIEAAQRARSTAIVRIKSELRRETSKNETARRGAMKAHYAATKRSLRDIFGVVAFSRGAAVEMVERFRKERKDGANEMWSSLNAYTTRIRETVSQEVAQLAAARLSMASRERSVRRDHLKEVQRRLRVTMNSCQTQMGELRRDRQQASRAWEQHVRGTSGQVQTAKRAVPKRAAPKRTSPEASGVAYAPSKPAEIQPGPSESTYTLE